MMLYPQLGWSAFAFMIVGGAWSASETNLTSWATYLLIASTVCGIAALLNFCNVHGTE